MKKFWIVMLAAALFLAFTMPAIAAVGGADVKFSGTLRMRGWYDDNQTLMKANDANGTGQFVNKTSQAFYDNRLRMGIEFKVAEGLTLVTRFDALEKKWGQTGANPSSTGAVFSTSTSTGTLQGESVNFERAYVDFKVGVGTFKVGYQDFTRFGTVMGNTDATQPGIKYIGTFGAATIIAAIEKRVETRWADAVAGYTTIATAGDKLQYDSDVYDLGAIYKFTGGEAGILYQFINDRTYNYRNAAGTVGVAAPYNRTINVLDPYVKFKSGPVYVEAEAGYLFGKWMDYDKTYSNTTNMDLTASFLYLNAQMDFKPFYAGVKFLYASGDDPATADKKEGSILTSLTLGQDHDFALMYGNFEFFNMVGAWTPSAGNTAAQGGASGAQQAVSYGMDNAIAYQGYVGMNPTPKLNVFLAYTYINAAQKPRTDWQSDNIGQEVDLRASYKIFDNLSYTIGAGYFFTGDYFKGTSTTAKVDNDYLLMHQLLLSF
jgi:hypothetical protein